MAFDATLALRRRELDPATATRMLLRYPAMTAQVVAKIYWQALRLKLKRIRFHAHPAPAGLSPAQKKAAP